MDYHVIGFRAPIVGIEERFNTFRLGTAWSKLLIPGMKVILINETAKMTIAMAEVERVEVGTLAEMCERHAHENHSHLHVTDGRAGEMLNAKLKRLYGPHIATDTKRCTVIWLRRMPCTMQQTLFTSESTAQTA